MFKGYDEDDAVYYYKKTLVIFSFNNLDMVVHVFFQRECDCETVIRNVISPLAQQLFT